ncbi:type I restriction-modification system subunit M [Mycoplasmopsis adleri]|uniref:type I restriction-modification system subunit M n=1 Tax=Mycoplasmopsis adleri TaxID=51362 RepID=UPI003872DE58
MATNKNSSKEAQRTELHKTIWKIANDLRGSVDGWDFKQYVLGFLFYRYISENLTNYVNSNEWKAGDKNFDYAELSDEEAEKVKNVLIQEKGFYIAPSNLFKNVAKNCRNDSNLNETLDKIFKSIEASAVGTPSENDIKGLFNDVNVNNDKLGNTVIERNKRLRGILEAINEMQLGAFHDHNIDAFGDAYEYLMTMYAANAGKSDGEFFTPQEVSELLASLTLVDFSNDKKELKKEVESVYDPACGSGSLLLKYAKILGKENVTKGFFGQEINLTTYNLARINMFLHGINFADFSIKHGDTLNNPCYFENVAPFEAIVSNPPYSIKWDGDNNPTLINDPRFAPAGVLAPKSKADLAFVMHILYLLSSKGSAAIVEFPGVLYRGGAEQKIRQYLIDNNYVDAIIQLPPNLFFGTSIATCIIILRKNKRDNNIFFVNASNEFVKEKNTNKLSDKNIKNILDIYCFKEDKEFISRNVPYEEVKENDYSLSVSTYVKPEDTSEKINIVEVNAQLKELTHKIDILRKEIDKIIKEIED